MDWKMAIGFIFIGAMAILWYLGYRRSYRRGKEATKENMMENMMQEIIEVKLWLYGVLILIASEKIGLVLALI